MTPRDKELRALLDEIYELPNVISSMLETGSHEFNNRAAKEWYEKNKWLAEHISKLITMAEGMDPQ